MQLMLQLFTFFYKYFPLIFILFWSYSYKNWYLLFGLVFTYFGSYTALSKYLNKFIYLFTCLCIGVWLGHGFSIYDYITFFFFCSLWGYLTRLIALEYYKGINNPTN